MAARRELGRGGPSLSQVTYGTMRLSEHAGATPPGALLLRLHDGGIDTHHSSSEYDSYPLYLRALRELGRTGRRVRHIVKLAEPSFDDVEFDPNRLKEAIDQRLTELDTEQLSVVQWMIRTPDPTHGELPLEVLHNQRVDITTTFDELKRSGKVGEFAVFPYTNRFACAAQHELGPTPICAYVSLFERGSLPLMRTGQPFVALRPFAGAAPDVVSAPESAQVEPDRSRRFEAALRYPLLHPDVTTTVVSVNQPEHVELAIDVAQTAKADLAAFELQSQMISQTALLKDKEVQVV